MKTIKYKGELYRRVDELTSEEIYQAAKELTELHNLLGKVFFGDIEEYLEYMAKKNGDYRTLNTSFKGFVAAYQKFYNDLRKVRG